MKPTNKTANLSMASILCALALSALGPSAPVHADQVAILDSAVDAIEARLHILDSAEVSIDMAYFSIHDDDVTRATLGILREKVLDGVRVRIITASNGFHVDPAVLYHLSSLGNFEIRLYDLTSWKHPADITRVLHDKLLLVDDERYITGGRNLGEIYFDLAKTNNKKDRDVYVIGSSASTASQYFNNLWNSTDVVEPRFKPYTSTGLDPSYCDNTLEAHGRVSYERCRRRLNKRLAAVEAGVDSLEAAARAARDSDEYRVVQRDITPELRVVPDDKVLFKHNPVEASNRHMGKFLEQMTLETDGEILVQSPYVIPTPEMMTLLEQKQREGVQLTFVTNSIKSTVNVIAQGGYVHYRKRMLDRGAVFIESAGEHMLHAKSIVFRNKPGSDKPECIGGVGSYNIDPRSANLNTEMYFFAEDCGFADELEKLIMSYAEGGIRLASRADLAKLRELKKDVGFFKRFQVGLMSLLAPLIRKQI